MTVNLAWRDAMAAVGSYAAEDFDAGFATSIAHTLVAAIQRPYERPAAPTAADRMFGSPGYQHMMAMRWQLEADCVAGVLKNTVRNTKVTGRSYMIEASDFAAWLASRGETPSKHVAAWFAVRGVAWPPASADVKAGEDSPFPLSDFPALVTYRKANTKGEGRSKKGPSWALGNQIDVAKTELARRVAAGVTRSEALNAMGHELGIGGAAPRTPLKKALFSDRKRSPPLKVASPLPGVVQVRSGRKTA